MSPVTIFVTLLDSLRIFNEFNIPGKWTNQWSKQDWHD